MESELEIFERNWRHLKKSTLIRILPETIAEHVIQKYDEENSCDDMEQFVFDYLE